MKSDTRIEVVVLVVAALVVGGGWLGWKLIRKDSPQQQPPPPTQTSAPPRVQQPRNIEEQENVSSTFPEVVQKAQVLLQDGKAFDARELLTSVILEAPEDRERNAIKEMLVNINKRLLFSREKSPDAVFYKIQPGDSLAGIATKQPGKDFYFAKLIQQINGIRDAKRIPAGRTIKIPKGRFSALVQKSAHRLIVFLNGHYIKEYPVALGASISPTPEETFQIDTKQANPVWYAPDGHVYKYGHPKNILGTRWLGFKEKGEYQSYGIHGTADPDSIGKNVSNGCIRMLNTDVEEVFTMLMKGATVKVVK